MELPFTVVFEPPTPSELSALLRKPLFWLAAIVAIAGGLGLKQLSGHLAAQRRAQVGIIQVTSQPADAVIQLAGRAHGRTPARITAETGHHQVRLELQGCADPPIAVEQTEPK